MSLSEELLSETQEPTDDEIQGGPLSSRDRVYRLFKRLNPKENHQVIAQIIEKLMLPAICELQNGVNELEIDRIFNSKARVFQTEETKAEIFAWATLEEKILWMKANGTRTIEEYEEDRRMLLFHACTGFDEVQTATNECAFLATQHWCTRVQFAATRNRVSRKRSYDSILQNAQSSN